MDPRHHSVRFPVPYSWVPTKEEMEMLETYSSIWTEEDYKNHEYATTFDTERCNAIQRLVRARLFLETNTYLMTDVDKTFGQVYLAPVAGYKHGIKPTGLANDPLASQRGTAAKMAPSKKGVDIVQMLTAAKQRYNDEQVAKATALDAEYAKRCAAVRTMNAAILAEEQRKWRAAGAPPTMAEKLRGVVKPAQPSWDEWQKTIVFLPEPTRAQVQHEMELAPFLEEASHYMGWDGKPLGREWAEQRLAAKKAPQTAHCGCVMEGTWQHWELPVLENFIYYRMSMVPY